jgi:hypothetical protein
MKVQVRHFGKVVRGRKVYNNPELYNLQLQQLEGKEFEEIIKVRSKRTTDSQHAYYRGAILPACFQSEMFGHCDKPDDIHEYFADRFLSYTVMIHRPDGTKFESKRIRSMADLNRQETSEYIARVKMECEILEIQILSPEEYYNKLYNKQ